jgi:hypothetical protein
MPLTRYKILGIVLAILAVGFVALQFVRPRLSNPPITADLKAPDDVKAILQMSCYNCHSNETKVPWFDNIVPAYWLVVRDVKRGRIHLNFSNLGKLPATAQKAMLYESVNQIQLGAMPPANYLLIHPSAKVTPAQLDVLKNYLHPPQSAATASNVPTADELAYINPQGSFWATRDINPRPTTFAPAPNGLAFFPDYLNWKPVSTTDRFDNGTFRVILGNDIAQRAIAANNIHPWPDGSTFAKIAWKQHAFSTGVVKTDDFVQVEFMTKDATKYAKTEGWGFGRWRGLDLKPYGHTAAFVNECTSCHRPMKANDFVFTTPIHDAPGDAFNATAALPASLPYQPLQWRVITSLSDKKAGTMSTLYGNDTAVDHYRGPRDQPFPQGGVLAMVTWRQQDDAHWFGGRIPGKSSLVEFVSAAPAPANYTYQRFEGATLQKVDHIDDAILHQRLNDITSLDAAVLP